jgi:hypothetical protein
METYLVTLVSVVFKSVMLQSVQFSSVTVLFVSSPVVSKVAANAITIPVMIPANTTLDIVLMFNIGFLLYEWLDGVEGFEPSDDGTKSRCLTAWRYPNILK